MDGALRDAKYRLGMLSGRLDGVSPVRQLSKGLAFVTDGVGRRLSSVSGIKEGDEIRVRLRDGTIVAQARKTMLTDSGTG